MKADDVTSPQRQKELETVALRLAKFNANKIALERSVSNENLIDEKFSEFTPDQLKTSRDERVQIGYRLAYALHLDKVFGIDENSDEIDYFPWGKVQTFAKETGQSAFLESLDAAVAQEVKAFEESQRQKSVADLLIQLNLSSEIQNDQRTSYYSVLQLSDKLRFPGADLNAFWYMRNAKIFSKLLRIAKPGDRIVVLFGAGHNFWLRHFAENTPQCELVEPNTYLQPQ